MHVDQGESLGGDGCLGREQSEVWVTGRARVSVNQGAQKASLAKSMAMPLRFRVFLSFVQRCCESAFESCCLVQDRSLQV